MNATPHTTTTTPCAFKIKIYFPGVPGGMKLLKGPRTPQDVKRLGYAITDDEAEAWPFESQGQATRKAKVLARHFGVDVSRCVVEPQSDLIVKILMNGEVIEAHVSPARLNDLERMGYIKTKIEGEEGEVWKHVARLDGLPRPEELNGTENFDILKESIFAYCNSYEKMEALLSWKIDPGDPSKWFRLLGCIWENCDNIGWFLEQILERLENADRSQLDAMMTPDEIKEWRKLPNSITAFRGCSWENAGGMSYSLNEEIAARFPFLVRYYTEEPILLKAKINKRFSVLKLGRNEFEIILTKPKASKLISWIDLPVPTVLSGADNGTDAID